MSALDPARLFAMRNSYAMERLERPGVKRDVVLETSSFSYGPTRFAGSCAEIAAMEVVHAEMVDLPDAVAVGTTIAELVRNDVHPNDGTLSALSTLLRYTYGFLRWEPFNDYKQHRAVPSPRSLFPLDLYVVTEGPLGEGRIYRYSPHHHALVRVGSTTGGDGVGFKLLIAASLGHLPPYGELSPALAFIEAGALQAQISLMCRLLGWGCAVDPARDVRAIRTMLHLRHWSEVPSASISIDVPDLSQRLDEAVPAKRSIAVRAPRYDAMEAFARLRSFVAAMETDPERTGPAAAPVSPRQLPDATSDGRIATSVRPMLEIVAARSSGCRVGGLTGRTREPADLAGLLIHVAAFESLRASWPSPDIKVVMSVFGGQQIAAGDYLVDLTDGSAKRIADGDDSAFHTYEAYYEINFATLAATFTLCFDLSGPAASAPTTFRHAHQRAGEIVQAISLAASASSLFARPYRSFRGQVFQTHSGVDCEPLIQVIVGTARSGNPALAGATAP